MANKKDIQILKQDTKNIITNTLAGLIQGLTGVATSSKKELILSVSHTFQKMRGGHFLSVLLEEWNKYKEKGKVKDDYQFTEQHKVCLSELLEFLDKDSPDELRFKVLKQIFLVAASEKISDRNSYLPQQFMKLARSLSDGEVLLLTTIWRIANNHPGKYEEHYGASRWIEEVTNASGLKHRELVEIHEKELMDKRLLTPRLHSDNSGVKVNPHYRLSSLGYELCRFINNYEE
jgi:hypothetical protein